MERMNLPTTFCMESGQIKTGENKDDTYVRMLQEVVRVTPAIAYGIAADFPSVVRLIEGFKQEGPGALQDIEVRIFSFHPEKTPFQTDQFRMNSEGPED